MCVCVCTGMCACVYVIVCLCVSVWLCVDSVWLCVSVDVVCMVDMCGVRDYVCDSVWLCVSVIVYVVCPLHMCGVCDYVCDSVWFCVCLCDCMCMSVACVGLCVGLCGIMYDLCLVWNCCVERTVTQQCRDDTWHQSIYSHMDHRTSNFLWLPIVDHSSNYKVILRLCVCC